jgi:hypothetical protein
MSSLCRQRRCRWSLLWAAVYVSLVVVQWLSSSCSCLAQLATSSELYQAKSRTAQYTPGGGRVNCASAEGIITSTNNGAGQTAKHKKLQVEKWGRFLASAQHREYCVAIRNEQQWDERGHWGSFGRSEQGMQSCCATF